MLYKTVYPFLNHFQIFFFRLVVLVQRCCLIDGFLRCHRQPLFLEFPLVSYYLNKIIQRWTLSYSVYYIIANEFSTIHRATCCVYILRHIDMRLLLIVVRHGLLFSLLLKRKQIHKMISHLSLSGCS